MSLIFGLNNKLGTGLVGVAEAEIDDLDLPIVVNEDIFRLQIAMGNANSVEIVDSVDNLLENFASLILGQPR